MPRKQSARLLAILPGVALGAMAVALVLATRVTPPRALAAPPTAKQPLDPAAWGSDHVGREIPQYAESGECLFCHRDQVGATWQTNKHNRTIRDAEPQEPAMIALAAEPATKEFVGQVQLLLGNTRAQRFLKRQAAYGKVDLLSASALFGRGRRPKIEAGDKPHWDADTFALECAGCHATAVNPQTHAFATVSLDCFSCHGDAPVEHTEDAKLALLDKAGQDPPAVTISICASCHVRFGKSKSSGLPYPTNFVPGDNLFKDFVVDWKVLDDAKLNAADAHVMENVRDVVLYGQATTTCLSCHDVHAGSSKKHRDLPVVRSCQLCHAAGDPIKGHKNYEVHSRRCRY